jgi:hypothetical protein
MGLFHRKPKTARPNRVISHMEQVINRRQRQIAVYLDRKTQHWNKASKMILLIAICLLFGGASLWLLIRACY